MRYLLRRPNITKYYKNYYDWYLTKYYRRNIAMHGNPTIIDNTIIGNFSYDNYLELPTNAIFTEAQPTNLTISARFNVTNTTSETYQTIFMKVQGISLSLLQNTATLSAVSLSDGTYKHIYALTLNTWYEVDLILNGTTKTVNLYSDGRGKLLSTISFTDTKTDMTADTVFSFGKHPTNSSDIPRKLNGYIDLKKCSITQNNTLLWQGVEESSSPEFPWVQPVLTSDTGGSIIATNQAGYFTDANEPPQKFWRLFSAGTYHEWQINSVDTNTFYWGNFEVEKVIKVNSLQFYCNFLPPAQVHIYGYKVNDNDLATPIFLGSLASGITQGNWITFPLNTNANDFYKTIRIYIMPSSTDAVTLGRINVTAVEQYEWCQNVLVANNTRTYNGQYTYKKLNHVEEGTVNDYDTHEIFEQTYSFKTNNKNYNLRRN